MDVANGGRPNAEIGGRDIDNDDDDLGDPQVDDGSYLLSMSRKRNASDNGTSRATGNGVPACLQGRTSRTRIFTSCLISEQASRLDAET
jgi:hypothetical protein